MLGEWFQGEEKEALLKDDMLGSAIIFLVCRLICFFYITCLLLFNNITF